MLISESVVMMLQTWHFRFSHFLLPIDVAVYGNFDFMRMFPKFGGCLYAQIGVTSNGRLDGANLVLFLNSLIVILLIRSTDG